MTELKPILTQPDLLTKILEESNKGSIGELDSKIAIININWTKLVKNRESSSSNLAINSKSGAGKDRAVKVLYSIIQNPDTLIHRSKITPEVFTYWHQGEEDWTWDGKQLYLEDVTDKLINGPVFKTMASGGSTATVVDKQRAKDIEIKGKPNITVTGYNISFSEELLRRFVILHLDESNLLTSYVKEYKSKEAMGILKNTPNKNLREALQNELKEIEVVVPFANKLNHILPDTLLMRDYHSKFLDWIKGSCAGYQKQREQNKQGQYIATWDDYSIARITLLKVCSNTSMISTSIKDEKVLQFIRENEGCSASKIAKGTNENWYCYQGGGLAKLEENGLVTGVLLHDESANKTVKKYFSNTEPIVNVPLFPEGIEVDKVIKEDCDQLARVLRQNLKTATEEKLSDLKTTLIPTTGVNSIGIKVLRYLLYNGISSILNRPKYLKNHKYLPYGRYLGDLNTEFNFVSKEVMDVFNKSTPGGEH